MLPVGLIEEKIHVSRLKRKRKKKNNEKVGETILVFGLKEGVIMVIRYLVD